MACGNLPRRQLYYKNVQFGEGTMELSKHKDHAFFGVVCQFSWPQKVILWIQQVRIQLLTNGTHMAHYYIFHAVHVHMCMTSF